MQFRERVSGCLKALAIGDAIGKQTETLSRAGVERWYPDGVSGFHGRPGDVIPHYSGKRYEWRIGETTDDTEQTLAVGRALLRDGKANHTGIGRELLLCRKSLHPGVALWEFIQAGDPSRVAAGGDGCGAAMRAAPVGIFYRSANLDDLVQGACECAIPTHGGRMAIGGAAAVAGAVAAAVDGRCAVEVLNAAMAASHMAECASMAQSIETLHSELAGEPLDAREISRRHFPIGADKVVSLAISLALIARAASDTVLLAANIGGDADSVASIGGAIAGALYPESVNEQWFEVVRAVNGGEILDLAASLAQLA